MEIKSHNSRPSSFARQLFVPRLIEMVLYGLTSVVFLTIANAKAIWEHLNNDPVAQQYSSGSLGGESGSSILGTSLQGRLGQILVWGLLGVLIYTVIWFLKNLVTNLRNDIVADEYVHPHSYSRAGYWKSIAMRKIFFFSLLVLVAGFLYLCFKLFPIFSETYLKAITSYSTHNILSAVAVVLAMTLLLHVFVALVHLTISSWQFIHADL